MFVAVVDVDAISSFCIFVRAFYGGSSGGGGCGGGGIDVVFDDVFCCSGFTLGFHN